MSIPSSCFYAVSTLVYSPNVLGALHEQIQREETIADSFFFFANVQPHDAIDFTDNDIQVLGNFPLSPRITTLLLARNRVANIQPTAAAAVPNLRNLVLASNSLAELADVDTLGTFTRLTHLVLADNPVTKKEVRIFFLFFSSVLCAVRWVLILRRL